MDIPLNNKPDIFCIILEYIIPNSHTYDDFATYMRLAATNIDFINQSFLNSI
jgi:hypothetical protein